jgi:hypothetical protein
MNRDIPAIMKQKKTEKQKHVLEVNENAFSPPSRTRSHHHPKRVFDFSKTPLLPTQNAVRFTSKASAF